jgi:hypothetical protein
VEISLPTGDTRLFSLYFARGAEFHVVYKLDNVGHTFRDTARSWSILRRSMTFGSRFVGFSYSEFEWCVFFCSARACVDGG